MPTSLTLLASSATPTIHVPHIDYLSILPMLIMMGGALVLMAVTSLFRRVRTIGVGTSVTVAVSVAAVVAALSSGTRSAPTAPR